MKYIVLSILSLFIVTIAQADVIDERSGITISHTNNEATFPASWMGGEINATVVALDSVELERSILAVKSALAKYPVALLKQNLSIVYVFKSLTFFGQGYGGTCSAKNVYLSNEGALEGYTDHYLEQTFHHEFSSILWKNYKPLFNEIAWVEDNGLKYGKSGVQALIDGTSSLVQDSTFNAKGFLFEYAQSSLENDINSFAENIFLPTEWFESTRNKFPILAKKYKLIVKFYSAIDGQFTSSFFKSIASDTRKTIDYETGMRVK